MATDKKRLVIGVTGPISGGKGTVGELLKEKGFFYTSTSDRIREEITSRGQEITRERLLEVSDELRRTFGPEVLAARSWDKVESQPGSVVIDSIRGEAEVDFLKTKPGFILIGVTAPRELRFERIKARAREKDPLSWEVFLKMDEKDVDSGLGRMGRNIRACLEKADYLIENIGTLEELKEKIEEVLKKIAAKEEK